MYKRILLKISGEALQGSNHHGIDYNALKYFAQEIVNLQQYDHEIAVVIGAGNIWRYRDTTESGIERTTSDNMGMLATIINSVALQSGIEQLGIKCRVCSAIFIPQLTENYIIKKAKNYLQQNQIVICAGGTGNPFFTTDSAGALRALELNCDLIIKATKVDGIYDTDPSSNPQAKKYEQISFAEAINKGLKIMDQTAFALCQEGNMPIIVLNMDTPGSILTAAQGGKIGTLVSF